MIIKRIFIYFVFLCCSFLSACSVFVLDCNNNYNFCYEHLGKNSSENLRIMNDTILALKKNAGNNFYSLLEKSSDINLALPFLIKINLFYNQIPYVTDQEHWGVDDYWATPIELVSSFGGDCEDYAIAKYMTLKELGFPLERLRITYVKVVNLSVPHMVLYYYPNPNNPNDDPLVLDNLIPEIKPASSRTDLIRVYSFNDNDFWLANNLFFKGEANKIVKWTELLNKMKHEKQLTINKHF